MLKWDIIDRASLPGQSQLVLARRGDEWSIRAGTQILMSSRNHASEETLARLALERAAQPRDVLVGGLGMGFTLRAALDLLPPAARVVVVELVAALVDWNRGPLGDLAGRPLDDGRVEVRVDDVHAALREARKAWDVVLLDIDNGPAALTTEANQRLYSGSGLAACRHALRPGGLLAVWSAGRDDPFRGRMERVGFEVEVVGLSGGHTIYLGRSRL